MIRSPVALTMIWLMTTQFSFSQYFQYSPGMGGINWSEQILRANGHGTSNPSTPPRKQRSEAIQAAKNTAVENLMSIIKDVYVDSKTTLEEAIDQNEKIAAKVREIIEQFQIIDARYEPPGQVELDIEVPLRAFYELLLILPEMQPPDTLFLPPDSSRPGQDFAYTGIIIDARGLEAFPALSPRVLDENGKLLYGRAAASRECAAESGLVGYERILSRAEKQERVRGNPLIVEAIRAAGRYRTDVVVAAQVADAIRAWPERQRLFHQCRVMILLD